MTLELITKSHGIIDAGFFVNFTKLTRLGEYTFEVKDLCELGRYLAKNSSIPPDTHISGFNLKTYEELFNEYMSGFSGVKSREEVYEYINGRGQLSLEEKAHIIGKRIKIPVRAEKDAIKIGKYEIGYREFAAMIHYLLHGGFIGWCDSKPDFVDDILIDISNSRNPIFSTK